MQQDPVEQNQLRYLPSAMFITPRWCASLDTIGAIWKSDMSNTILEPLQLPNSFWVNSQSSISGHLIRKAPRIVQLNAQYRKAMAIRVGLVSFILLTLFAMMISKPAEVASKDLPKVYLQSD